MGLNCDFDKIVWGEGGTHIALDLLFEAYDAPELGSVEKSDRNNLEWPISAKAGDELRSPLRA
jgi:hypothetical protein